MKLSKGDKVICLKENKHYQHLIKWKIYTIVDIQFDQTIESTLVRKGMHSTGEYIYRLLSGDLYVNYIQQYVNRYNERYDLDNDLEAIENIKNNCYFMPLVEWREQQLKEVLDEL
jgi:hypothetical protein